MVFGYVTLRAFVRYLTSISITCIQYSDPDGPHIVSALIYSHLLTITSYEECVYVCRSIKFCQDLGHL